MTAGVRTPLAPSRPAAGSTKARSQHPAPSTPAIGHSDAIRSAEASITSIVSACQYEPRSAVTRTRTCSPGRA